MQATIGNELIGKLKSGKPIKVWDPQKKSFTLRHTPQGKPFEIWDQELKGFILRVQPTGVMTFICEYDRHKRITIGPASAIKPTKARETAKGYIGDWAHGIDPMAARRKENSATFKEYIEGQYATHLSSPDFRPSHATEAMRRLRKLYPIIGSRKLMEIDEFTIDKYRKARLKEGVSPATTNRELDMVKAALNYAVSAKTITVNPIAELKRYGQADDERVRYLTPAENQRLRAALDAREQRRRQKRDDFNQWRRERGYQELPPYGAFTDHLKPLTLIALNTGMRRGELFSLTWNRIDWITKYITVPASRANSKKTRRIPINDEALDILKALQKESSGDGLVFANIEGDRLGSIKTAWKALMRSANIKDFHFHDCRHDFASQLRMRGVDLGIIQELLGHSKIEMTQRYAHLGPGHLAAAVAQLGAPK